MDRIAVPALGIVALVAVLLVPSIRFIRRTRRLPMAIRPRNATQRVMSLSLVGCCAGYAALFGVYGALGPEALGVWEVPQGIRVAGWVIALTGLAIVALAQAQMGLSWRMGIVAERTALVTHGLFRWARNPIFAGMLATLTGLIGIVPCGWTLAGFGLVFALLAWEARLEEAHLSALHGEDYRRYAARVGRFVPWAGRLKPGAADGRPLVT